LKSDAFRRGSRSRRRFQSRIGDGVEIGCFPACVNRLRRAARGRRPPTWCLSPRGLREAAGSGPPVSRVGAAQPSGSVFRRPVRRTARGAWVRSGGRVLGLA
jgi:hypothetical protein